MNGRARQVEFRANALEDLRHFPISARREAGHQIDQVQQGRDPDDWKPMNTVGQGVREIRIRQEEAAFRVIYVARFADAIYVLVSPAVWSRSEMNPFERGGLWLMAHLLPGFTVTGQAAHVLASDNRPALT